MPIPTTPQDTLGPITQTPEEALAGRALANSAGPTFGSTPVAPDTSPPVLDVVRAAFERENLIYNFIRHQGFVNPGDDTANWNRDWNPYGYFERNREEYEDMRPYILQGKFENVYSEEGFKRLSTAIRESVKNQEILASGGWTGFGAGMAAGILDVTSLIPMAGPLKVAMNGGRLANAARTGALLAGVEATNEALKAAQDPARPLEESWMNIGSATVIGAGLGSLVKHIPPRLTPGHPENPLDVVTHPGYAEHIDVRPGEAPAEGVRTTAAEASAVSRGIEDSVGAMRAKPGADSFELAGPESGWRKKLMDGINWSFNRFTPLAKSYGWLPKARETMLRMADNGGLYTKGMLRKESIGGVMEDRMMAHRASVEDALESMKRVYIRMNMALGQSKATAVTGQAASELTGKDLNRLSNELFWSSVRKRLVTDKHLHDGYTYAKDKFDAEFDDAMRAAGVSDEMLPVVRQHVEEAAQIAKKSFSDLADTVVRSGIMDPDLRLGDGYGLPVIYKKGHIDADPQQFVKILREWLTDNPTEEWLEASRHGEWMKEQGYKTWADVPPSERDLILKEWQGDKEQLAIDNALTSFESAARALQKAEHELEIMDVGLKQAQKDAASAKHRALVAEAVRVETDYFGRKLAWAQARVERAAERVQETLDDGIDFNKIVEDIDPRLKETGPLIDTALANAQKAREGTDAAHLELGKHSLPKSKKAREALTEADVEEIKARREQALKDLQEAVEIRKAAEEELNTASAQQRRLASFKEKVVKAHAEHLEDMRSIKDLDGLDNALRQHGERAAELRTHAEKMTGLRKQMADELKLVRAGRKATNDELRAARKEFNKAARLRARLSKAVGLNEYLDNLVTALRDGDRAPNGILIEEAALGSGRLKARKFKFSPEVQDKLERAGFIETDIGLMMKKSYKELGGMDAAQKTFGTTDIKKVIAETTQEYDEAVEKAMEAGDQKLVEALNRQRKEVEENITTVWNRITGRTYLGGDGPETLVQGTRMVRSLAYLGIAGGITLSAAGDLGTALLSTRGFFRGMVTHMGTYRKLIENAKSNPESARQLRSLLTSMETAGHITMSGHMEVASGLDDVGITASPVAHGLRKVNEKLSQVGDKVNILSGLRAVSDFTRRTAAFVQMDNLIRWVRTYDDLPESIKVELASYGVGEAEAKRFKTLFDKFGYDEVGSIKIPRIDAWKAQEDGDYMRDVFNGLILKTQRRASIAAGAGSLPGAMDHWIGAMLLQFQSYAFQFTNNVIIGGMQRGLTVNDTQPLMALGVIIAANGLTSQIRASMRGEDTSNWDTQKWAREIMDRSGLIGIYGPAKDSLVKLVGPTVNEAFGTEVLGTSSRYRNNTNWYESLLGPWAGVLKTVGGTASDVASGEYQKAMDKAYKLIPLHQMHQAITALGDAIDDD